MLESEEICFCSHGNSSQHCGSRHRHPVSRFIPQRRPGKIKRLSPFLRRTGTGVPLLVDDQLVSLLPVSSALNLHSTKVFPVFSLASTGNQRNSQN